MQRKLLALMAGLMVSCLAAGCSSQGTQTEGTGQQADRTESAAPETEAADNQAEEEYVIRVGIPEAMDNPIGVTTQNIKDLAEEKSGGRLKLEIYPSNQLGGPREMLEAVGLGNLEMTVCTPTDLTSFVPEMGVLTFPYLFRDAQTAYEVLDGEIGQELSGYAQNAGFKVLGYPEIGFRHITNSVRPITKLEDFQGIKIRTRGVTAHLETFQEFGANPVSISFSELYAALQQKIVDGQENSTTNIYFNNFFEVQDYLSLTNTFYEAWSITINNDYFAALPEDLQNILQEAVNEAVKQDRENTSKQNDEYLEKLKEVMTVNEIAPEEMDRIVEAAQNLYPKFSEEVGEEIVNKVMEAIK